MPSRVAVGLNCALGAKEMRAHIAELGARRRYADLRLSECRPAQRVRLYDESPEHMAETARRNSPRPASSISSAAAAARRPTISRAIAAGRRRTRRRARIPEIERRLRLSGLEPFTLTPEIPFVNVGERTNVTGSAKFRKLITAGDYDGRARGRARPGRERRADHRRQHGRGPARFRRRRWSRSCNLIAAEPDIARVPVMIDSSKFSVIEAGLKCVQGKAIVNSISMKEGEEAFIHHAQDRAPLWRGRGGDGLRRKGPGRYARAQDRDLRARL